MNDLAPQLSETATVDRMQGTRCELCEFRHEGTAKRPPWRWLCMKHLDLPWGKYVKEDGTWEPGFDPYLRCVSVNGGSCPLYQPKEQK